LLNYDIAAILKDYVFEDLHHFLEDNDAIASVYEPKCTKEQAKECLKYAWA
jgi:hypothetical protein